MADELQFFYIVKLKSLLQQTLCRKLLDGLLKAGNGFGHRDKRLTASSILMTATFEVTASEEVYVHITARAQRHTDKIVMLHEDSRHTHLLDCERIIHKALAVALLEPEATHLLLGERHMGNSAVMEDSHLSIYHIAK